MQCRRPRLPVVDAAALVRRSWPAGPGAALATLGGQPLTLATTVRARRAGGRVVTGGARRAAAAGRSCALRAAIRDRGHRRGHPPRRCGVWRSSLSAADWAGRFIVTRAWRVRTLRLTYERSRRTPRGVQPARSASGSGRSGGRSASPSTTWRRPRTRSSRPRCWAPTSEASGPSPCRGCSGWPGSTTCRSTSCCPDDDGQQRRAAIDKGTKVAIDLDSPVAG